MLRVMTVVVLGSALLASNAMAQGSRMGKYDPPPPNKPLVTERDYKAASDRIPLAEKSNDPWAGAREPAPDPSTAPATAKTRKKP